MRRAVLIAMAWLLIGADGASAQESPGPVQRLRSEVKNNFRLIGLQSLLDGVAIPDIDAPVLDIQIK